MMYFLFLFVVYYLILYSELCFVIRLSVIILGCTYRTRLLCSGFFHCTVMSIKSEPLFAKRELRCWHISYQLHGKPNGGVSQPKSLTACIFSYLCHILSLFCIHKSKSPCWANKNPLRSLQFWLRHPFEWRFVPLSLVLLQFYHPDPLFSLNVPIYNYIFLLIFIWHSKEHLKQIIILQRNF